MQTLPWLSLSLWSYRSSPYQILNLWFLFTYIGVAKFDMTSSGEVASYPASPYHRPFSVKNACCLVGNMMWSFQSVKKMPRLDWTFLLQPQFELCTCALWQRIRPDRCTNLTAARNPGWPWCRNVACLSNLDWTHFGLWDNFCHWPKNKVPTLQLTMVKNLLAFCASGPGSSVK